MSMSERSETKAAAWWGILIPIACVIVAIVALDWYNTKNYRAPSVDKQTSEAASIAAPMKVIAEVSLQDASHSEAPFAVIAAVSTPDVVDTAANEAENSVETLNGSLRDSSQALAPETPPVQFAAVNADDVVHRDLGGVVLPGSSNDTARDAA
jgi:hypothetical protein